MRIALLASGRSYHATRWANGLSERGIKIGFFTIHPVVRPLNDSVEVFSFGKARKIDYVLSAKKIKAALKSWGPDLMHCHYATGYGLLGKLTGYDPRVVSLYGADVFDFPKKSVFHRRLLRYILFGSEVVMSTSNIMAREFQKIYPELGMPAITPFGVDLTKFSPSSDIFKKKDVFNIGIVKKLERKYGIDILIDAFSVLVQTCPQFDWNLNIVGEGGQLAVLKEQVKGLGLNERINFLGPINNNQVPQFLRSQDIFVVPSREESESFGVAAVEAQACGLPVIASAVGGLPEVVCDKKTGLIVKKEDHMALYHAIKKLCLDEELRYKLSIGARDRAVKKYDWSKNLDQMIEIYKCNCKSVI